MPQALRIAVIAALASLPPIGAAAMQAPTASRPASDFRPDLFFAGRTRGTGTIKVATSSRPRVLSVEGFGRIEPDGGLVLDQAVSQDGKTTQRSFRVHRTAEGTWVGSLTDAVGAVRGTVAGNRMTLGYRMRGAGMRMHQTLDLQPGGRVVLNRARVTLLGVQVALVEETIEKLD